MQLSYPCIITPRLRAGVNVEGAFISIAYCGWTPDRRRQYLWAVDLPDGQCFEGSDLASGVGGGSLHLGLSSLLSFLGACGESVSYAERNGEEGENADLFPAALGQWCAQNSDELSMVSCELEETPTAIVE